MLRFIAFALLAVGINCQCPSDEYKELNNVCYRATEAGIQSKAIQDCNRPFETLVDGSNVDHFNDVKQLFLAKPGTGTGPAGPGGPGKYFWVAAKASDGSCLAGWSRSSTYQSVNCGSFYPALCQLEKTVLNPMKNQWSAQGASVWALDRPEDIALRGPQFAIDGVTAGTPNRFYHSRGDGLIYDYLQVELPSAYKVVSIKVTHRQDGWDNRFEYYEARVGTTDSMADEGKGAQLTANAKCGTDSGAGPRNVFVFNCGAAMEGNFITIQRLNKGYTRYLEIDEVDVTVQTF